VHDIVRLPPAESLALMMVDGRRRVSMRYDKVAETSFTQRRWIPSLGDKCVVCR
jgi:hypothetical protein